MPLPRRNRRQKKRSSEMNNFGDEGMPVDSLNAYSDEAGGDGVGVGIDSGGGDETDGLTKNLSSINEMYKRSSFPSFGGTASSDGRQMRRAMALAAAACLLIVGLVVFFTVGGGGKSSSGDSPYPQATSSQYALVSRQTVDDLQSTVAVFKHSKSGLEVVAMIPKDRNEDATFGINFRTPSGSDDGAQYVVENSVLAGSSKFPVKDPFNQIKRGSLQTYMESWTERDRTSFVASTRNLADYRNIMNVMIDAVFHPLFIDEENKWIYRQEGWRLESPDGKKLAVNGNAFNAAIAAQMDPSQAMTKQIYRNLFSGHSYAYVPRGDASQVVTMTYEEVVDYHKKHYHPSNGQAFCYGQQDYIDACLNALEPVLGEYTNDDGIRHKSKVEWMDMTVLDGEQKLIGYPSNQEVVDYRGVIAWVLNDEHMDLRQEVAWHLIHELLVGSPAAIISRIVYELQLGDDVIGFFQNNLQQWVLGLGVSGIATKEQVEVARNAIIGKLNEIVNDGFEKDAMTAALNKMEFRFREQTSPDTPRGAKLFHDILGHWNYDRDPLQPLHYSKAFADLRKEIEEKGYNFLLDFISKRIVNSPHTTYLDMHPSRNYEIQWEHLEKQWLQHLTDYISVEEGREFLRETSEMKKIQEQGDSEQALAALPRLQVSDLSKDLYTPPLKIDKDLFESGVTTLEHELPFTNGVAYLDFAVDISNMDFDDVVLLPLFCRLMLEGGTDIKSDIQILQDIDKAGGSFSVHPLVEEVVQTSDDGGYVVPDGKHLVTKIVISGACVATNQCMPLFNLFRHVMWDANIRNKNKAEELLMSMIGDMEDDMQNRGHYYTTQRIESRYSLAGFVREQWKGVTQLMGMRRALAKIRNGEWEELSLRLIKMQDAMKRGNRNGMVLSVTGDRSALNDLKGDVEVFFTDILPPAPQIERFPDFALVEHPWVTKGMHRMESEIDHESVNQGFLVPTRVNHVGKGGLLFDVGERITGADLVVSQYLGGYYLYDRLRFSLGAQEAWAVLDTDSGVLVYQSDRDPNILETLQVYNDGSQWVWDQLSGDQLPVEARASIVGAIGSMDGKAMVPNRVGVDSIMNYLKQNTAERRQRWRDEILSASAGDFKSMVDRLAAWGSPSVCIVTNQKMYDAIDPDDFNMTLCDYSALQC
eukprot:CAMPEP_0113446972 /NCGR_PEP_ID=MMETSP0014_2-20120614/3994_1 /TAXON_ID=2857 /ORGANISM="Nitzschia sp." /LENGTH=1150 /DNA_ID=CAMNT_0000338105 /DNA_START=243 /DNA_END=3695 /DNA_ORIENTATION=- /assembly_acc=CAM_ASM_000159